MTPVPLDIPLSTDVLVHGWYLGTISRYHRIDFDTMSLAVDMIDSPPSQQTSVPARTRRVRSRSREQRCTSATPTILDSNVEVAGTGSNLTTTIVAHRYLAVGVIWPTAVAIPGGTGMQAIAT